jgi:hypothetical protein
MERFTCNRANRAKSKHPNRSLSRSVKDVANSLARKEATLFGEQQPVGDFPPVTPTAPNLRGAGAKKTISDLHLPEAAIAVKESINCSNLKELQSALVCQLGQNSQETRLRYARFIIRWFFPDGLDGIARKTWIAYLDGTHTEYFGSEKVSAFRSDPAVNFVYAHTSGHATVEDLQKLVEALNPKMLVPVHTESPEDFKKMFPKVERATDGAPFSI